MAVIHNFLTGTQINYQKSLFFDLMKSGDVYMGMTREEPIWGFSTLVKVLHTRTWPTGVMGVTGDLPSDTTKFYDINSLRILDTVDEPTSQPKSVSIGYILKTDDATDIDNFVFLDSTLVGSMELDYMNQEWARIRKLDSEYLDTVLTNFTTTLYDYYFFNYTQAIESRTQIEAVSAITLPEISSPVRLQYSTVAAATVPTTAFGNNLIGDLTRDINTLGEMTISGLTSSFVTTGKGYVEDNNLSAATFYLTNAEGTVLQDNMKYVNTVNTSTETSIVFSYPLVSEGVLNSGRLKITSTSNPTKLAIFPENFSDAQDANDNTPPPFLLNYLKTGMIHTSLFDVLGIVQIEPEFAEQITCLAHSASYDLFDGGGGLARYFSINASDGLDGENNYYVWFDDNTSGVATTDPTPVGRTGIQASVTVTADAATAEVVAEAVRLAVDAEADFTATRSGAVVTIKNVNVGPVADGATNTSGFTVDVSNDISFARRIDNTVTQTLLDAVPEISIVPTEIITIDSNPDSTVTFAITDDPIVATSYYFDLVRIIKKINSTTPTDKIYRQLFICYKPKISTGATASALSYSSLMDTAPGSDPLFQNSSTKWGYDMGTILYIANKQPVFREHLSQDETFTLMI